METTVLRFRNYQKQTGVSYQKLADSTGLNRLTIIKILNEDNVNLENQTIKKLKAFLDQQAIKLKDFLE